MIRNIAAGLLTLGAIACGSSVSSGPTGDGGTVKGDASLDVAVTDASAEGGPVGPYACGTETCQTGEYCIHPCLGGALPECLPQNDAGQCADGTQLGQCLSDAGPTTMGCVTSPPPPFCDAAPKCPGGGGLLESDGKNVACACA